MTYILKMSSDTSSSCATSSHYQIHSFLGIYRSAVLFAILIPAFQIFLRPHHLTFLSPLPSAKGMVSHLYNLIISLRPVSLRQLRTQWEDAVGEISEEQWGLILRQVHTSSICARHGLTQCKILHRVHFTKVRLSKIYDDVDPMCDRCRQAPAAYIHMLWSCPSLHAYWLEVFNSISICIKTPFERTALSALFGVFPPNLSIPKHKADFVAFVTVLAQRLILMRWKSSPPLPLFSDQRYTQFCQSGENKMYNNVMTEQGARRRTRGFSRDVVFIQSPKSVTR